MKMLLCCALDVKVHVMKVDKKSKTNLCARRTAMIQR